MSKELVSDWETNSERIFPILNKLDRIWYANHTMNFATLILDILGDNKITTDLEFTRLLDKYIENKNIK